MPKLRNKFLNKVPTPWMHSMFCFTVMQVYSCWNFTCQSGLVWEGVPNNKFGQWKFFPPNSLTRFPPWGFIKEPKIRNSWWMQCLDDQCRSHLGTKPKDLRLPLVCEEKDVLSSLDVFRGGSFCLQFLTSLFSEAFKSFAQTCLGTNARPLVLFKCASGCLAPAKGCAMFGVNDWHQRC